MIRLRKLQLRFRALFVTRLNAIGTWSSDERSDQSLEFFNGEAGVLYSLAHREGVDWIVTRDHDEAHTVAHDRVLALKDYLKARLPQGTKGRLVVDARQPGYKGSDRDDFTRDLGSEAGRQLGARLEIFVNGVADVCQSLFTRRSLAATTGKLVTPDGKSFLRFDECHRVFDVASLASHGRFSRSLSAWIIERGRSAPGMEANHQIVNAM